MELRASKNKGQARAVPWLQENPVHTQPFGKAMLGRGSTSDFALSPGSLPCPIATGSFTHPSQRTGSGVKIVTKIGDRPTGSFAETAGRIHD